MGYLDEIEVDRTFLVQHHLYGNQNVTVLEAVKGWPDRFRGFAYLGGMGDPDAPDRLERLIDAGMTGLKVEVASTRRLRPEFRFDGDRERKVWERLNQLKRPLVVDVNGAPIADAEALRGLLQDFSQINLIVCHVGGAPRGHWREHALVRCQASPGLGRSRRDAHVIRTG